MSKLDVSVTAGIDRPAEIVRRQFADVAHHASTTVHQGVQFEVIDDNERQCRYRQVTRLGPLRLTQEFELPRTDAGPLVNTVTKWHFTDGTITFVIEPDGTQAARVEARIRARLRGAQVVIGPLLRSSVRRALRRALAEDKADLEEGNYPGWRE